MFQGLLYECFKAFYTHVSGANVHMLKRLIYCTRFRYYWTHVSGAIVRMFQEVLYACFRAIVCMFQELLYACFRGYCTYVAGAIYFYLILQLLLLTIQNWLVKYLRLASPFSSPLISLVNSQRLYVKILSDKNQLKSIQ